MVYGDLLFCDGQCKLDLAYSLLCPSYGSAPKFEVSGGEFESVRILLIKSLVTSRSRDWCSVYPCSSISEGRSMVIVVVSGAGAAILLDWALEI